MAFALPMDLIKYHHNLCRGPLEASSSGPAGQLLREPSCLDFEPGYSEARGYYHVVFLLTLIYDSF